MQSALCHALRKERKEGRYGNVSHAIAHAQTIAQTIFLLIPLFVWGCIFPLDSLYRCPLYGPHKADKGLYFRGYKYLAYASNRGVFSKGKKSLAYAVRRIQSPPKYALAHGALYGATKGPCI